MRGQYRSTAAADEWMAVRTPPGAPRYATGVAVAPDPVAPVTAPAYPAYPAYPVTAVPAWHERVPYPRPPQWHGYPPVSAPPRRSGWRTARRVIFGLLLFSLAPLLGLGAFVFVFNAQSGAHNRGPAAAKPPQVGEPIAPSAAVPPSAAAPSATLLSPAQIVAKVNPTVVNINVRLGDQNVGKAGTGVVLTSSGLVLTNNHVISGGTAISAVDVGNGRTFSASVVGFDRSHDIALIQLRNAGNLKKITVGDSSKVKVGDGIVAIGNAGGEGGTPTAVTGKVTALGQTIVATEADGAGSRRLTGMIEVNADIQPGDSGGPLVNRSGQLVGINTAASTEADAKANGGEGYAVPSDTAIDIAQQIQNGDASATVHIGQTALLGVNVGDGKGRGAAVTGVLPGGPAQDAGLRTGDVIRSVDGDSVDSPDELTALLDRHHPGDRVEVEWVDRNGRTRTATVELAVGAAG